MKNYLLFALSLLFIVSCAKDDTGPETTVDEIADLELEIRKNCNDGEFSIFDATGINQYLASFSNCKGLIPEGCPNLCSEYVKDCFTITNPCITKEDLRKWVRNEVWTQNPCGKPYNGICNPSISLEVTNGVPRYCLSGTVWKCPIETQDDPSEPTSSPCDEISVNHSTTFDGATGETTHTFVITNNSAFPRDILINGNVVTSIPPGGTATVVYSSNSTVTLGLMKCTIGTYNPIG